MQVISVSQLSKLVEEQEVFILDVRNPDEFNFCAIGGLNIPLGELEHRLDEIPRDRDVYCLCHHGVRSAYAAQLLMQNNFEKVWNIEGGIDAWSISINPDINRY